MTIVKACFGFEPFHRTTVRLETEFHGTSYGGWAILANSLTSDSIVFSVGLGQDISFDRSVMAKYACQVYGFDPTPDSIAWIGENVRDPGFHFVPLALADREGTMELFLPSDDRADRVSASAVSTSNRKVHVPCASLTTLLDHSPGRRCDLLKLDIEGCEYAVIEQASPTPWFRSIPQLLIEFHHFLPGVQVQATHRAVKQLRNAGYEIAWISRTNHEYLFVQRQTQAV